MDDATYIVTGAVRLETAIREFFDRGSNVSGEELQTPVPALVHGCLATRVGEGTVIQARVRYISSASVEPVTNYHGHEGPCLGEGIPL
ncbi:hypothetical protein GTY54_24880 [Streptomyces sp. SID625]|nr:hypothetical protein [Streptomyces sp. SID625]MYR59335.1 hypothetical protein [Streptomyces sp. SID625]